MPLNIPGLLVSLQLLWKPRLVLPHVVVKDIRKLNFQALRQAGYRGAVFDKDNCLTRPNEDSLVPELQDAWKECREVFGEDNVLVVSNSAGSSQDPGGIHAESVSHHLSVPVLYHRAPKPAYACITALRTYFASLPNPVKDAALVVVGDRIMTDVVMANRMHRAGMAGNGRGGPLAVWTSGVWERENMLLRWVEQCLVAGVRRWTGVQSEDWFIK